MKIKRVSLALLSLVALLPLAASAQTVFFFDKFANGSSINAATPGKPTTNSASYETVSSQNWGPPNPSVAPNDLRFGITNAGGGNICEIQALFATNQIALTQLGDYIQLTVVFTNTSGIFGLGNNALGLGLYNGSQVAPLGGGLNGTEGSSGVTASGGVAGWAGYTTLLGPTGSSLKYEVMTRPVQAETSNNNQDLVTTGSSTKSFASLTVVGTAGTQAVPPSTNQVYTEVMNFTLIGTNTTSLAITNSIYLGTTTNGTLLTQIGGISTNATTVAASFDGLAIGFYQKTSGPSNFLDIVSILVSGQSTPVATPPTIVTQPVPVAVPTGAACDFNVVASGFGLTYQWHRNGTNLVDGGNISGAKSSVLVISPAGSADVASGNNGYSVTVSGTGGFSVNSTTNALSLTTAKTLTWTDGAGDSLWNLNNSANWQNQSGTAQTFNFGDKVTFDETGGGGAVTLSDSFLSASLVTVNTTSSTYTFSGTGSFAGSGSLLYEGSGQLSLNVANSYTGGTIISNASAHVYLQNYAGLGNGPVTMALAGGEIEIVPTGSASSGINGNLIVNDDFTILADATGSYGAVFLGDISGVAGKTLTLNAGGSSQTRVRAYGTNTLCNISLNLESSEILFAPYSAGGSQTYNGLITGPGGMMQKGTITYLNYANTFSGSLNLSSGVVGVGVDSTGSPDSVSAGPLGTGPLLLTVDSTTSTTGSGQINAINGARTIGNSIQFPTGTNNLTLIVGGTNALTFSGTFTLSGNDSQTTASITARTVQVTNTAATTFSGTINDTVGFGYGLIKTGSGSLYVDGTASYTGWTTNNSGSTNSPGLLAGHGTFAGPVSIQTNSAIGGGSAAAIGTLTINNQLQINGNGWFRLDKSASQSNDSVTVSGNLSNIGTGTITVTNLNASQPIAVGDKFTLFSKPVANGAALAIAGAGINWTNLLAVDGSIKALSVITTMANYPTNVTFSLLNGTNLTIGWPATHQGWILQSQTNALGTGLTAASTTWHDMLSTTSGTNASFIVNPANPAVFFRLRHP